MKRNCNQCGRSYEAIRPQSKYCKPSCRVQHSRNPASPRRDSVQIRSKKASPAADSINQDLDSPAIDGSNSLVKATMTELEAAGVLDTMLGQQALRIATQMSGFETAGGMAALSKELSRVMAEAMRAAVPLVADPVDELAKRREEKLVG